MSETGPITGTADKNYNLTWFTEKCQSNTLRLGTYIQDAQPQATPTWLRHGH